MSLRFTRRATLSLAATLLLGSATAAFAQGTPAATPKATDTPQPRVLLSTSMGDIVLQLDAAKAPQTVANFVQYVQDKHYDGTIFHRVIDGFMIQGGGFTGNLQQKPTRAPIELESRNGLKNEPYTIAMARTSNPHSATAQFFINVGNNHNLNAPSPDGHGYAVFGKVIEGHKVVDQIRAVRTSTRGMHQNVPTSPVTITAATLLK